MRRIIYISFLMIAILACTFPWHVPAEAAQIDELKEKIDDRNRKIEELEQEIAKYQKEIETTGKQASGLQSAIRSLELERKRLLAEIKVTQNKIASVSDTITTLQVEIENKQERINENRDAIRSTIKTLNEMDSISFIEDVLTYNSLSELLDQNAVLLDIQSSIQDDVKKLQNLKRDLEGKKTQSEQKKGELLELHEEYSDKKHVTEAQKLQTNKLLQQTRNQEAAYKKILEEKKRLKDEFEAELFRFESELRLEIDPGSLPPAGSGVLKWPLSSVHITQQFGDTEFSRKNPGVYNGKGHNGVDFRAARGTAVKAALSGVVEGVGNTDSQTGCYSYGKWVLIRHANGLSTLYAHLDLIKVSPGTTVATGDVVGLSGNTGYSTGPHLHFSVYASQGVKIVRFGDVRAKTNCSNVSLPVADLRAYLNPLLYL